jgi:hypothetical protein
MTRVAILVLTFSAAFPTSASGEHPDAASMASESTKLVHPPCKTTSVQREGGDSTQVCPGPIGYQLLLLDSDGRMSVTVVTPDAVKHPLDFSTTVTPHFSSVGSKAEWRIRKHGEHRGVVSVILPLDVKEDPDSNKVTPYWIVAKISSQTVCVVQKIQRGGNSLSDARRIADSAEKANCLAP